ncbi:hypothetical protein EJ03DRAFT_358158 [Teratosphaeria nubilosa]|uniref:Uncharacterized protein n=1 Tax=Teratosphaeria nubilosa TaxID=161662 RepID=A0A6G1KUX4_9PEZI|nr:hypothetical protein EJ03DRAFT_358158 [Teratosphaeria nubilosa]
MDTTEIVDVCPLCGEPIGEDDARFARVRIGLDETPERIWCRCPDLQEQVKNVISKLAAVENIVPIDNDAYIGDKAPAYPNVYVALVTTDFFDPYVEREISFQSRMIATMFTHVQNGVFGNHKIESLEEFGCWNWWTGPITNDVAKLRMRSTEGLVVKVNKSATKLAPGVVFAISHAYSLDGVILRPEYRVSMNEMRCATIIAGVHAEVIVRQYVNRNDEIYSYGIEVIGRITYAVGTSRTPCGKLWG